MPPELLGWRLGEDGVLSPELSILMCIAKTTRYSMGYFLEDWLECLPADSTTTEIGVYECAQDFIEDGFF